MNKKIVLPEIDSNEVSLEEYIKKVKPIFLEMLSNGIEFDLIHSLEAAKIPYFDWKEILLSDFTTFQPYYCNDSDREEFIKTFSIILNDYSIHPNKYKNRK